MGDTTDQIIFWSVVTGRFLVPLAIFKYPLPGIIAAMLLDGVDQTIFETFTSLDLSQYQSYDKALDVFYLSVALIAAMRNWDNRQAFAVARFLYFYRLAGSAMFEFSGGTHRELLLIFPNTFEYFFIFYELVRTRWNTARFGLRWWLMAAAGIWIFVKIPQETWIHVAQLDLTDTMRDHLWFTPVMLLVLATLATVFRQVIWPQLDPVDHDTRIVADALPDGLEDARERAAARAPRRVFDTWLLEKLTIVTLLCLIFASIIPGVNTSTLDIVVSCAVLVIANSSIGLWNARRGGSLESVWAEFLALTAINIVLVVVASRLVPTNEMFFLTAGFFFIVLLTLIVTLYDRYRPVLDVRTQATVT